MSGKRQLAVRRPFNILSTRIGELKIEPNGSGGVGIHYWLPLSVAVILAAIPWFRFRFSLRTLLIVTTLIAVGLGLVTAYLRLW